MMGKEESRVYFCGGRLEFRTTTMPFVVQGRVVVVKDVLAHVCVQCEEATVEHEVAVVLDQILKDAHHSGFEISMISYQQMAGAPAIP